MSKVIDHFRGEHDFLSNFHKATFEFDGKWWTSSEHAFMSRKCLDDKALFDKICVARTAAEAKKLGRMAKLPEDWDVIKYDHMLNILRAKFKNTGLRAKLIATYPAELIEGNTWGDKVWGCIKVGDQWVGDNALGKTLMRVRDEIMAEDKTLYKMMGGNKEKPFTICVSGPRPQNLGISNPFSDEVYHALVELSMKALLKTKEKYPNLVVRTGMALGFDQAIASACICYGIPFIAVIPGDWQHNKWSNDQKDRYFSLMECAQSTEDLGGVVAQFYDAMMRRNSLLIQTSDAAIVLDVGSSGTADTIKKLESAGIKFWNVNPLWEKIKKQRGLS